MSSVKAIRRKSGQCTYPICVTQDQSCEPDSGGSNERGRGHNQTPFQALNLQEVLRNSPQVDIVIIRFADATQEVNGVGEVHVLVQGLQDIPLCLKDLTLRVRHIHTVEEIGRSWHNNLFYFRRDEHAGDANELELGEGDDVLG